MAHHPFDHVDYILHAGEIRHKRRYFAAGFTLNLLTGLLEQRFPARTDRDTASLARQGERYRLAYALTSTCDQCHFPS